MQVHDFANKFWKRRNSELLQELVHAEHRKQNREGDETDDAPHQKDQCRLKKCGEGLDQGLDFFLHAVGDLFQQFIDAGGFLADGNDMTDVFRKEFQLPHRSRKRDALVVDIDDHLFQSTDETAVAHHVLGNFKGCIEIHPDLDQGTQGLAVTRNQDLDPDPVEHRKLQFDPVAEAPTAGAALNYGPR